MHKKTIYKLGDKETRETRGKQRRERETECNRETMSERGREADREIEKVREKGVKMHFSKLNFKLLPKQQNFN